MTKKMALPDEVLDAVSGGYLYLGDEKVLSHDITPEAFTVTTKSGTYRMDGNPDHYKGKPGAFKRDKAVFDKAARSGKRHIQLHAHLFEQV